MSDDWSVKNWVKSVTATRAGGMDFQKVTESLKWQTMIQHERPIEMESMMVHIRKWHKEGLLDKHPLGKKLDKLVAETGGYSSGGHGNATTDSKVWFPTMGLGPIVPRNVKTMEPNKYKEVMSSSDFGTRRFGATLDKTTEIQRNKNPHVPMPDPNLPRANGYSDMPGEVLTTKQLVSRMKTMQSELGNLRKTRKNTERTLKKLKRNGSLKRSRRKKSQSRQGGIRSGSVSATALKVQLDTTKLPLRSSISRSSSRKSNVGLISRRSQRSNKSTNSQHQTIDINNPNNIPSRSPSTHRSSGIRSNRSNRSSSTPTPSISSSTPSLDSVRSLLDGSIPLGYTQTKRATTSIPKKTRSRPVSRVNKKFSKYNKVLQLWEHYDRSLPKGHELINKRDTYHSNNISALFSDPRTYGKSMSKTTMAPPQDLIKMGLLKELDVETMRLFQHQSRANRVMSPLTRFAEHAVKNRLKPFAVGRG